MTPRSRSMSQHARDLSSVPITPRNAHCVVETRSRIQLRCPQGRKLPRSITPVPRSRRACVVHLFVPVQLPSAPTENRYRQAMLAHRKHEPPSAPFYEPQESESKETE